jgi:hypothetical protein
MIERKGGDAPMIDSESRSKEKIIPSSLPVEITNMVLVSQMTVFGTPQNQSKPVQF